MKSKTIEQLCTFIAGFNNKPVRECNAYVAELVRKSTLDDFSNYREIVTRRVKDNILFNSKLWGKKYITKDGVNLAKYWA